MVLSPGFFECKSHILFVRDALAGEKSKQEGGGEREMWELSLDQFLSTAGKGCIPSNGACNRCKGAKSVILVSFVNPSFQGRSREVWYVVS